MNIERIKALNEMISVAINLHENSKDGSTTYNDDSDGQQVGRETICAKIISICADKINKCVT